MRFFIAVKPTLLSTKKRFRNQYLSKNIYVSISIGKLFYLYKIKAYTFTSKTKISFDKHHAYRISNQ